MSNEILLEQPFSLEKEKKKKELLFELNELTALHHKACKAYGKIVTSLGLPLAAKEVDEIPFLPVRLFKEFDLISVSQEDVIRTLTSSGTTGQAVSKIALDSETSKLQSKALVRIVRDFLGSQRRPMVIVDSKSIMKSGGSFGARVAAILGFSNFGRNHFWLLDENLKPDWSGLKNFIENNHNHNQGIFIFGFTFMVWQNLLQAAMKDGVDINFGENSYLVHGGGWKKLLDIKVDDETFRSSLKSNLGISHVSDYYGMVEQTGSIYMQCDEGYLHTPSFADVVIRDINTLENVSNGKIGIVQVISTLARSYPGHSLLTEDLGVIHGEDDCRCGRMGRYFKIHGRLPKSEARGCSDVRGNA